MITWQTATKSTDLWDVLTMKSYAKPAKISDRKFRLLACAGAGRMRHMMCEHMAGSYEIACLWADREYNIPIFTLALQEANRVWIKARKSDFEFLNPCLEYARDTAQIFVASKFSNEEIKCRLIRGIFYEPQRAPLMVEGCRLMGLDGEPIEHSKISTYKHGSPYLRVEWVTARVRAFAEQLYQEQDEMQYLALADMMEEDGCDMPTLLQALRNPVPIKGFWALDFVLGRR